MVLFSIRLTHLVFMSVSPATTRGSTAAIRKFHIGSVFLSMYCISFPAQFLYMPM